MKQVWMCMILALSIHFANAQDRKVTQKPADFPSRNSKAPASITLTSENSYNAFSAMNAEQPLLRISDPFIITMNNRAKGITPPVKNVELLGMPKGAYGFAHGRLRVFPGSTTSHGSLTGMGSVATGSSTGTMGSIGLPAANGKSTFAATGMWGNALGIDLLNRKR